jgi:hypothetical protein
MRDEIAAVLRAISKPDEPVVQVTCCSARR